MWTAKHNGLVCPYAYQKQRNFDKASRRSVDQGWPVYLRLTGGGTVPQGRGIDNLVLAFDACKGTTIEDSYRLLILSIKRGLGKRGSTLKTGRIPGSFCDGTWNLSSGRRKIVGAAQRWRPHLSESSRVLAHAIILTRDTFQKGIMAVSSFHNDLGLGCIETAAHTSMEVSTGHRKLPSSAICEAALEALQVVNTTNFNLTQLK